MFGREQRVVVCFALGILFLTLVCSSSSLNRKREVDEAKYALDLDFLKITDDKVSKNLLIFYVSRETIQMKNLLNFLAIVPKSDYCLATIDKSFVQSLRQKYGDLPNREPLMQVLERFSTKMANTPVRQRGSFIPMMILKCAYIYIYRVNGTFLNKLQHEVGTVEINTVTRTSNLKFIGKKMR